MRRRSLRTVLLAVVALAVPLILLRVASREGGNTVVSVKTLANDSIPDLLQRIRDFHRVVTRGGEKLIEISAKEASYFRDSAAIEIVEPKIVFFDKGERVGEISGGRGSLYLDGTDVRSVELAGDVHLSFVDFRIRANRVSYDRGEKQVVTYGPGILSSNEFEVRGNDLTVDLGAKTLKIPANVDMRVRRNAKAETARSRESRS